MVFMKEFFEKFDFEKNQTTKKMQNYPACKELINDTMFCLLFQVNLLDGKRSLNVNIFLKQFRMSYEEIVDLLRQGDSDKFGAEKLKNLQKVLPSQEEVGIMVGDGD